MLPTAITPGPPRLLLPMAPPELEHRRSTDEAFAREALWRVSNDARPHHLRAGRLGYADGAPGRAPPSTRLI